MIKIVTDSIAHLPQDIVDEYGITVIPAYVIFGAEALRDGIDLTASEFYRRLASSPELPSTAQPSVADFTALYRRLLADDPSATILSVHISGLLSGVIESGRQAATALSGADIRLFDTRSAGLGHGLMVREAAVMASQGRDIDAVLKRLDDMREGMQLYFTLDTLAYLAKGGRIGRAARLLGTLLDAKPILTLNGGVVDVHGRRQGRVQAIRAIRDMVAESARDYGRRGLLVGVMHADCEADARQLADEIEQAVQPEVLLVSDLAPSLGVYIGPGAVGVAWYVPRLSGE
jgi:DegV family protein with EDD domain